MPIGPSAEGLVGAPRAARRMLTRRALLTEAAFATLAVALSACVPGVSKEAGSVVSPVSGSGGIAAAGESWTKTLEAARAEGTVHVYGASLGTQNTEALVAPFESAFSGIKVEGVFVPAPDAIARIVAERTAGKYLADILIGPGSSGIPALKPSGTLAPLKPALMLPEVLDEAAWLGKHLWWADAAEPVTTLLYQGTVQPIVEHNTQIVPAGSFSSYWDLLDPKWKGRIIAADFREAGGSIQQLTFLYKHPSLGPTFLERLFRETNLTLGKDQRQMIDWVAQGRFPVGLFLSSSQTIAAATQGLPIAIVPGDQFKEGAPIGSGGGAVMLVDRAPHPNAAKVYLNWLLSKQGQTAWQKATQQNSLRTDVPKEGLSPFTTPQAATQYMNAGSEEFARIDDRPAADVVNALLTKALASGSA